MKRFIYILISFILSTGFGACSNKSTQDNTEQINAQVTEQVDENTNEPINKPIEKPIDKQIDEQDKQKEESITKVKNYLKKNYDKVNIDGSTSMVPLHQSLNTLFGSDEKTVKHSKTVDAFEKLISGENDILLGVDYSDELLEKAKDSGIKLVKKEITREAFVFLINKNNPVKSLAIDQIKAIYSGKITNWSKVGGDDAPIKAYQRNSDSGSQIRMNKFMGDAKLMEKNVDYISIMGDVIELIGNYDAGKYSIAYNMYTFTEKQYPSDEVILLDVNGVHPNDESIFDETYPVNIYNYIYYDENNALASEFASNLYTYLMSDEGQKLISDSGYVNLNKKYDRNKNIDKPYEYDYEEVSIGFYNEEKGEFYDVGEGGKLLVFNSFADYILHDTKYMNNAKARDYLTLIFNSDIEKAPYTAGLTEEKGTIRLDPWFDASLDPEDFFNYKYDNMYYSSLTYFIDEDKYMLFADKDSFDYYSENGYLDGFSSHTNNYVPGVALEITKEELKNLYIRTFDYGTDAGLNYFQPFKA